MRPTVPMEEMQVHTHSDVHFVLVLSGAYQSLAYGAERVSHGPALVFNPAGTEHRDCFLNLNGSFMTVSIAADRARGLSDGLPSSHPLRLHDLRLAMSLFRSLDDDDAVHGEALALELLDTTTASRCGETSSRHPPPWLKLARELIQDRHHQALGLEEIAGELDVHPVHLTRAFRKFTRQTPGEYHRQCRMERAMGLLIGGKLTTLEACLVAGYTDQPHFYRCFNAMYGMAPGAFRRITGLFRTRL
ncbi:helix-turn-helix domain-containing protein [Duganella sp. FT80W]|uniref:Helix-turn-helix domain-containing protein n=2 Tax=Duganella guangzhouensis TaxID=2666084 RepID=A0A6I2KYV6_9BURK|nr:helix-turn-helix domain-containing protein [Duganella guangzhouensis]